MHILWGRAVRPPTAEELDSIFRRHVLDVWFPRSLDTAHGGFLCDFDRRWRARGPHDKLLEFQARHTVLAAEASRSYPAEPRLRQAALHGFRYLRDVMWDRESGGWFHCLDRAGCPLRCHTKHAHGIAYAIHACVAVHEATAEPGALDLARQGFAWLDHHSHDPEHGGYFGFLRRDGSIIRRAADCPWPATEDTLGTPLGCKDANVNCDLFETLIELYRVWPDKRLGERLGEMISILCDQMVGPSGALHFFCGPDWTPIPYLAKFGYEFQTTYRLLLARGLAGDPARMRAVACRVLDHALRYGFDPRGGGFHDVGPGDPACTAAVAPRKIWWVQTEALKALCAASELDPENTTYRRHFQAQLDYLRRSFIDHRYAGMYAFDRHDLPSWRRRLGLYRLPSALAYKGDVWKDASHDGRAWLYCLSALRGAEARDEERQRASA